MGRVFHQYITGEKARKMYVCKQCKAHLTSYDDIIKRRLTNGSNKPSFIEIAEILKSGKF